jgi:CYTH domain-containing protein
MGSTRVDYIKNGVIAILCVIIVILIIFPLLRTDDGPQSVTSVNIERKFLVNTADLPWDNIRSGTSSSLIQSYVSFDPEVRIRDDTGRSYTFLVRTPIDDVSRRDVQFEITKEQYDELFKKKSGLVIQKTRYRFTYDGINIRIDIFEEDLAGLAFAEISFESVEEANDFIPPAWFGEDVTTDSRYRNAMLSQNGRP